MICPNCKGNGSYYSRLFGRNLECAMCNGSGFVEEKKPQEQTNEEWLRNCTTEELVELIRKFVWCSTEIWQKFCTESEDEETDRRIVLEWLQEVHGDNP